MSTRTEDHRRSLNLGRLGALLTIAGVLLSGPFSIFLVSRIQMQPAWEGSAAFVANFHRIQVLTFYFGFLLIGGSVLMIAAIYLLWDDKTRGLPALVFTAMGAGLIFFNYLAQTTLVPALVVSDSPESSVTISLLSMSNPNSIAWAIEMWGYGLLGLGTWLAAGYFAGHGIEGVTRRLFIINGVVSIAAALWTSYDLGWVLTTAGLVGFGVWNLLYFALALAFYRVLTKRGAVESERP